MKKILRKTMFVVMLVMVSLTGCGSSSRTEVSQEAKMQTTYGKAAAGVYMNEASMDEYPATEAAAAEEVVTEEWPEAEAVETGANGGHGVELSQESVAKKLIRNVDLEVETQEFDTLLANITREIEQLGGYVENCNTSRYSAYDTWNGSITARIPSDKLDTFLNKVAESSNIVYRNESVKDVTLQYVDLDTHKKSLITERDRLLELLEQAETVEDLITIESRLSEVRYQIESMEAQLRAIDNQVTYSTVYINIREVELLTPTADKSVWDEITEGFGNNVYRVFDGIGAFIIEFIISIPFLVVWAVIVVLIVLLVRLAAKHSSRRKQKKQDIITGQQNNTEQEQEKEK